jgi:hypothetical protein
MGAVDRGRGVGNGQASYRKRSRIRQRSTRRLCAGLSATALRANEATGTYLSLGATTSSVPSLESSP